MRKSLLIVLFTISVGIVVTFAHGRHHGNKMDKDRTEMRGEHKRFTAEERADRMAKELNLTDKERSEVAAMYKKQDEEFEKRREERQKQAEANRAERAVVCQAQDAELKMIIGEENFKKYEEIRSERMKKKTDYPYSKGGKNSKQ